MAVASYGSATRTSGVVRIVKDLDLDLTGRHVLVVEDIVDSGLTLSYLRGILTARNPASLAVCALRWSKTGCNTAIPICDTKDFRIPPILWSGTAGCRRAVPQPPLCVHLSRADGGMGGASRRSAL